MSESTENNDLIDQSNCNNQTLRKWFISRIIDSAKNLLLRGLKLFQQFGIDAWIQIKSTRLRFLRYNQKLLSTEFWKDHPSNEEKVILPCSFVGSYRYLNQLYSDACTLLVLYGKPDLFVTFTMNPNWEEIQNNLRPGETYQDRPDLCVQVYNLKFKEFLVDIKKRNILRENVAYDYNTEYQKWTTSSLLKQLYLLPYLIKIYFQNCIKKYYFT